MNSSSFYLRHFRDVALPEPQGPKVWMGYLVSRSIGLRSPKGLAQTTDYYAIQLDDAAPDHRAEPGILQRIDSDAAKVFADVQDGDYVLDPNRRGCLALFMALLVTRLPTWRNAIEIFAGDLAAATMKIAASHPEYFARILRKRGALTDANAAEVEETRQSLLELGSYSYRGTPEMSLRHVLEAARDLSDTIARMRWIFLHAPAGARFVTSDHPVHWHDSEASSPRNVGLESRRTVLSFPMSPTLCLMASWHRQLPPGREAPRNIVDAINNNVVQFAEQHVYASSRDNAEAALVVRSTLEDAGEPLGPRAPDLRVATEAPPSS